MQPLTLRLLSKLKAAAAQGLWPDSVASTEDPANCQRNIVLRRNIGRWPRQGGPRQGGNHAGSPYVARNYPDCDGNIPNGGGNW